MSVFKKSILGVKYNAIFNTLINVIQFSVTIVAARMLNENDFSILGILVPIIAAMYLLAEMGLSTAIIQSKEKNIAPYASSLMVVSMWVGFIIGFLLFIFRNDIADFYAQPEIEQAILILCLIVIAKTYSSVISALAIRNLDFEVEAKARFYSSAFTCCVTLIGLFIYNSYYFIILSYLLIPILTALYIKRKLEYTNIKFSFDLDKYKKISNFSTKILFSNLIFFISRSGIGLFAAKIFSSTVYGNYYLANQVSNYPRTLFNSVINNVVMSSLSKIQSDNNKFRDKSLELGDLVTFISSPISLFMIFASHEIFITVFGEKWSDAASIFGYLSIFIWFSMVGAIPALSLQSKGYAKQILNANLLRVPLVILLLYMAYSNDYTVYQFVVGLLISELVPILYLMFCYIKFLELNFLTFCVKYFKSTLYYVPSILLSDSILSTLSLNQNSLGLLLNSALSFLFYILIYRIFSHKSFTLKVLLFTSIIKAKKI